MPRSPRELQAEPQKRRPAALSLLGNPHRIAHAADPGQDFLGELRPQLEFPDKPAAVDRPEVQADRLAGDQAGLQPVVPVLCAQKPAVVDPGGVGRDKIDRAVFIRLAAVFPVPVHVFRAPPDELQHPPHPAFFLSSYHNAEKRQAERPVFFNARSRAGAEQRAVPRAGRANLTRANRRGSPNPAAHQNILSGRVCGSFLY
jgi:hypothetical protein